MIDANDLHGEDARPSKVLFPICYQSADMYMALDLISVHLSLFFPWSLVLKPKG